ncbi:hypothetical protein C7212DRAFT_177057 [Tuber magnatum]|uniref:Fe2OG dioxygenase domain-containing protein n=1 Tax=Tuber magnatum TaxID=42249 RepID=A0A317SU02_9PEZI|nr:hypothetical protein C7212DRAFT_177057 [Tuber magnatum]
MPPVKKKLKKSLDSSFFEPKSQGGRRGSSPNSETAHADAGGGSTAEYVSEGGDEQLDTDTKIAILASLHPSISTAALIDILLSTNGSIKATSQLLAAGQITPQARKPPSTTNQSSLESFISTQGASTSISATTSAPKPPPKGQTLHLYTPASIALHTPCVLHTSFLPPPLATTLLQELLLESTTFPPPGKFNLFSRTVQSPHRSVMYTTTPATTPYYYQGITLPPPRAFTPSMSTAAGLVEKHFRTLEPRGRITAALVNCYAGPQQGVGFHTDALTYIGPRAIICTLSLGVTREFRIQKQPPSSHSSGTYSIHLPHNSLLVMTAGMQESWKHSIPLVQRVDRHEVSGDTRIAITYRWYRDDYGPEVTPACGCGARMVLRPVWGGEKYFWSCDGEYRGVGEGCGYFKWAMFGEGGKPLFEGEKGKVVGGDGGEKVSS